MILENFLSSIFFYSQTDIRSVLRDDVHFDVDFEHCRYSHDDTDNGNCSRRTRSGKSSIFNLYNYEILYNYSKTRKEIILQIYLSKDSGTCSYRKREEPRRRVGKRKYLSLYIFFLFFHSFIFHI